MSNFMRVVIALSLILLFTPGVAASDNPVGQGEKPVVAAENQAQEGKSFSGKRAELVSSGAVEQVQQRKEYSEVYLKPDGKKAALISSAPIRYKAKDGSLQLIDNNLVPNGNTFVNKANSFIVAFPTETGETNITVKTPSEKEIKINTKTKLQSYNDDSKLTPISSGKSSKGTVNKNAIMYTGLFDSIDEEYMVTTSGTKNSYIINQRLTGMQLKSGEKLAFTEEVILPAGSKLSVENKIKNNNFVTDKDTFLLDAGGNRTGVFAHPTAYDGRMKVVNPKFEDILNLSYYVEYLSENTIAISVLVPVDWLNHSDRVYPVTIDPSFFIYESGAGVDGYQWRADDVYCYGEYMPVGYAYTGYPPYYQTYMMWIQVPIPQDSTINSVWFYFTPRGTYDYSSVCHFNWFFEAADHAQPPGNYPYPSARSYVPYGKTWNNYNEPWTYRSVKSIYLDSGGAAGLQEVIGRAGWAQYNNIGLKWGVTSTSGTNRSIYQVDTYAAYAPYLYVEYTEPAGIPAPPTNVTATDGNYQEKVKITWTASYSATSYRVYRNTYNDPDKATYIGNCAASPLEDTSGLLGTYYYYWVKAGNANGDGAFSDYALGRRIDHSTHYSVNPYVSWNGHESHVEWWYSQIGSVNFLSMITAAASAWDATPIIGMTRVYNQDDAVLDIYSADYDDCGYYGITYPFVGYQVIYLNEWNGYASLSSNQWAIVAAHEMGHAHSLFHVGCTTELMYDGSYGSAYRIS